MLTWWCTVQTAWQLFAQSILDVSLRMGECGPEHLAVPVHPDALKCGQVACEQREHTFISVDRTAPLEPRASKVSVVFDSV